MLVLLRGVGDEIVLAIDGLKDTRIRILRIEDGCVRIGFDADPKVSIIRSELLTPDVHAMRRHPYRPQQGYERERWREEKRD